MAHANLIKHPHQTSTFARSLYCIITPMATHACLYLQTLLPPPDSDRCLYTSVSLPVTVLWSCNSINELW
jgi:hypothetical protein